MIPVRSAHARALLLALVTVFALAACSEDAAEPGGAADAAGQGDNVADPGPTADASDASGPDAVSDAGPDAAPDAASDAIADADTDPGPQYAESFTVVDLDGAAAPPVRMAVRACAGLSNARLGGSVYVRKDGHDAEWLDELALTPSETVDAAAFLETCVAEFPSCVRYSYAEQQRLLPAILTAGAALGAVPLDVDMATPCTDVAFDATVELADKDTPLLATQHVFEQYADQTTGLAMLNPGYDTQDTNYADPALSKEPRTSMVDFVFSRKLFVVFLIMGCGDPSSGESTPEQALLDDIVNAGHWDTPLGVYGYNNSWLIGGYLFEAQTTCLESRNMGAIPTETGNLSFFSTRRPPIEEPSELAGNPPEAVTYDPAKNYVAFVVGDGDNIRFILSTRKSWLQQRMNDCGQPDNSCAPLTWSISPHLPRLAPDVLDWYYASAAETSMDYFSLPPSGHHYAYPTSLAEAEQDRFVEATEADARLLGVQTVVHWDWFDTWGDAQAHFLPKYAKPDGAIRGILPINVPYLLDAFPEWGDDEFYRVLTGAEGGEVVLFRPRQWRGTSGGTEADQEFFFTPQEMADELGGYPPGTVTWVYMTSDGGLNLDNAFMPMVKLLPDNVQLVSADAAAKLALSAKGR